MDLGFAINFNFRVKSLILLMLFAAYLMHAYGEVAAKTDQKELSALSSLSNDQLIREGLKCVEADSLNDRAIVMFTLVANRFYEHQTDTAIRRAASEALNHLGDLYLTHDIDYRKAYKSLSTARQIAEEDGNSYQLANIYNSLAHLYNYNADKNDDLKQTSYDFINRAAETAVKSGNENMLPIILANIALLTINDNSWGVFEESIRKIKAYGKNITPTYNNDYRWVKLLTDAVEAMREGRYVKAEEDLLEAKVVSDKLASGKEKYKERRQYSVNILLIHLFQLTRQYEKGIAIAMESLAKSHNEHHPDYELWLYTTLANLYEAVNQKDSTDYYYGKYLKLKDKLETEKGYGNVQTLDLRSEIENINHELELLSITRQKEKRQHLITLFAFILITIICLTILWVYVNLKRTHRDLFKRNEEMTRREDQHRVMREQWEAEKEQLHSQVSALSLQLNLKETECNSQSEECELKEDNTAKQNQEYQQLYSRILNLMETSQDIYKSKYSLNDLADALGVTTRAVSRAINLYYHSNFNTLLNDYRVREVSRLMHQPKAVTLTIEGLAEKAGFSSRTYFATFYKKATGLTPSEYLKMTKLSNN